MIALAQDVAYERVARCLNLWIEILDVLLHLLQCQVAQPEVNEVVLDGRKDEWVVLLQLLGLGQQLVGQDAAPVNLAHELAQLLLEHLRGVVHLLLAEGHLLGHLVRAPAQHTVLDNYVLALG